MRMGALYSGAQYGLKCKGLNIREYAPKGVPDRDSGIGG